MRTRTRLALLLLIVMVGFGLRVIGLRWGQGYAHSAIGDEIEAYSSALNFLHGQPAARYIGQPNFRGGKVPGPLWALLWIAGLKLGGAPLGVMWLILLLNTSVIVVVYVLARQLWTDEKTSLWAALFYATSPWAIRFSLGATNPLILCFLGGWLWLALWQVVSRPRSPHIFWVCVLLLTMPQFHMLAVFLVLGIILVMLLAKQPLHRFWLAAGLFLGMAAYTPYLLGEMHHHWSNTLAILHGDQRSATAGVLKIITMPVTVLSNLINTWWKKSYTEYANFGKSVYGSFLLLLVINLISLAFALASLIAFGKAAYRCLRRHSYSLRAAFGESKPEMFLAILLVTPLTLFLFTGHDFTGRYLTVLLPLLWLLPARLVTRFDLSPRVRMTVRVTAGFTIATSVYMTLFFYHDLNYRIRNGPELIPSFQKMEQIRQVLKADAGPNHYVQLDVSGFPPRADQGTAFGVRTLNKYVLLLERQETGQPVTSTPATYKVVGTDRANPVGATYEGHGIAIIRKK